MNDFKDKHGKTRIGKFLQTLGDKAAPILKDILNAAGFEEIAGMIQGSELSDHEKEMALELLSLDKKEAEEISKRWQSDMVSDSWLSKNVRPLVLMFLVLVMTVLVTLDSSGVFTVKEVWVNLIETLLVTVVLAYFGSRGFEKYKKIAR
jgi:hypothetical protein